MSRILYILFFSGFVSFGFSQTFIIEGKITEQKNAPAIGASVIVLKNDSSFLKGTTTDETGNFKIENVVLGNYLLKISYLGFTDYYKSISVNENKTIENIKLTSTVKKLDEIKIETEAIMATQSGDTTSYNSKAFKVNKDATAEDLVTKMPGVTIVDGKVQAQGEDVKQVFVDGKPFFGDDANSVLKNLPAEIIDKVQVFDKKSDQSQFTGFDDGNSSKTINIVTKTQFRNGIFGKAYGGYGYLDKYKAGLVLNRFKEKQRFTILVLSNNINEQNFSSEDLLGVMSSGGGNSGNRGNRGGGRSRGGSSGGSSESFLVDIKNGIINTNAAGFNYSDSWGKKASVSAAYFFNWTDNKATSVILRDYIVGSNNGLQYDENNVSRSNNYNHRLNLKFECKMDSLNTITLQPRLSLQTNEGLNKLIGENTRSVVISSTDNSYKSNLEGYTIAFPVSFRHSFAKKGRTFSVDLNPSYNGSKGNSKMQTFNSYYADSLYVDSLDQRSLLNKSGLNSTSNITYTEPLSKTSFLSVNYIFTYNYSTSEKNTYNRSLINYDYSLQDTSLSNVFDNTYLAHAAGLTYRYNKEKFNFSLGVNAQQAELYKKQTFPSAFSGGRTFQSLLPNAQFQYRFDKSKNIRLNYRTNNTPPSVDQLQDVLNNSNSLQLSTGNPDLNQNFQNNLFMRYSGVNTAKSTSLFVLLGGTFTNDYIGNSTIIANQDTVVFNDIALAKGSQITRPVNLDGYYNLRFFFNYSFSLKKLKSNLNINAGCNYNNVPALINNETNYSNTTAPSLGLVLSSNVSEQIDFTISSNSSYNDVVNSIQPDLNSSYLQQNSKVKLNFNPKGGFVFSAEYNNQYYAGLSDAFNQNISLLNAAIGYKFLKDKRADIRLFVFDILGQNNSIQRNITETYIEDTQTNILQRYFMLTFTYNIKKYFQKTPDKPKDY
ncbi:MAG: TonB-dependent receptor [Bacteroidia bacterium]|nr:TonB-dependent receptor [Bacteroidia bacterium]